MSRKVRAAAGGAGLVAVAAVVAGATVGFGGTSPSNAGTSTQPPANTPVTRQTLTETTDVDGTLDYGDKTTVSASGAGTVTWLPAAGAILKRGQAAYKVNNLPVPLLYGTLPLYRALTVGTEGADVKELESNLRALGYTGFTVDDKYSASTATAVKDWQDDLGLTKTGVVSPGAVVMAPGALRVNELKSSVGSPVGGPVFTYTGTTRVVDVALDVAKQTYVHKGVTATITLPDGSTVDGTVSSVGTVATTTEGDNNNSATTTIPVVISVKDQSKLGTLSSAPVDVTLVSGEAKDVLTVPVAALVALAEGGYGVQVVEGSTSRYVAVQLGMFADGRVEISGTGISEGTVVGIPK
jgi:peptidoglycan hydrolase-like protein with peptidoglycan-binding domain